MIRYLLDLGDSLKSLLLKGDTIIMMEEFDYSTRILDVIYAKLKGFYVDEFIVITHNILSSCLYPDSCVAFQLDGVATPLSVVNTDDVQKILNLAETAGVAKIRFVDKIGYYAMFGDKETCYVEKASGMYRLIHATQSTKDFRVCSATSLEETIHTFSKKNKLNHRVDSEVLYNTDALMMFTNGHFLLDCVKDVADLSVFVYALMSLDSIYAYAGSVLNNTLDNIQSVSIEVVEESAEPCEEAVKKSPMHRPMRKRGERSAKREIGKKSIAGILLLLIAAVGTISSIGLFCGHRMYRKNVSNAIESMTKLEADLEQWQALVNTYEYCMDTGDNKAFALLNEVNECIAGRKATLRQITMDDAKTSILISFQTEEEGLAFIAEVNKKSKSLMYTGDSRDGQYVITVSSEI